jgi:hypothetical protein
LVIRQWRPVGLAADRPDTARWKVSNTHRVCWRKENAFVEFAQAGL